MNTLIDRAIEALQSGDVRLRIFRRKDIEGLCNYKKKTIYISVFAPCPVSVLIHELIHWVLPAWSEETVLKYEQKLYNNLSTEDHRILMRALRKARRGYDHG